MTFPITPELRIAASPALLQRGCVNVIVLDEIKAQTGTRWERLRPSIWAHLNGILRQRLASTDFYVQVDDTTFVISAPSSNQEEAQIFCLRVAHELHTALLGPCEMGSIKIARVTGSSDDLIEITPVEGSELALLATRARLENAPEITPRGPAKSEQAAKPVFSHKFVPVWDSPKEAITTYRCASHMEQDGAGANARAKLDLVVTLARLRHATGLLSEHLANGDRFLVWIPISYDLLSSPVGRMEIASLCRGLSSDLRPYLLFEIAELPHGVPQSRLSELVGSLRPFCRGVVAQLPARIANYGAYQGIGLHAIGLSLSSATAAGTEMGSEIFKLNLAAKRQGIVSFVLDVPTEELLRTSRELGVNLLSSTLIGGSQNTPGPVRRLFLRDIGQIAA
jgi:hypothetical protein